MPSFSSIVLDLKAFATHDTVQRVFKTVVEVAAAQAALYTTVIPNPPSTQASAAVTVGAGTAALVWNLLLAWATKTKSAKLDALAEAIDKVVDQRLKEQGAPDA